MTALDLDLVPEPPSSPAVMAARQRRALVAGLGGGRQADAQVAKSPFAERRLRATDTVSTRYVDPLPGVDPAASREAGPRARPTSGSVDVAMPVAGLDSGGFMASATAACAAASTSLAMAAAASASRPAASSAMSSNAGTSASAASAAVMPSASAPALASASASAFGLRLDDALVVPAGALMRGYLRCHALLLVGDVVGNVHCTTGPVVIRSGASLKGRLVAAGDVYICGTVGDTGGGAVVTTRGKLTLAPGARVDGDVRSGVLDVYDGAVLNGVAKPCED